MKTSLFKNTNINPIDHNKKMTHVRDNINVGSVLDKIFNGIGNPYNIKVLLRTNSINKETYIVFRNKNYITTLDNELIPIKDITYLEIK